MLIVVGAVTTASPPAWTSSAGMLSTVPHPPLPSEGWGGRPLSLFQQWGAADAEMKVPSGENTDLKRSPFKA